MLAVVEYERCRLSLRREVKDLRQRYSLTSPVVVVTPDAGTGSDRKAA